jgi:3-phenylpropionate/trans-cinnamate dioxygenase ferredoxin subunit
MNDNWIEVAATDEIPLATMKRVEIDGKRYLIAHTESAFYAVDDHCSHEEVSLYLGCIQGEMIKCSLHGSRFSLRTGEPMEEPATEPIETYAVRLDGNRLYIDPHQNALGKPT